MLAQVARNLARLCVPEAPFAFPLVCGPGTGPEVCECGVGSRAPAVPQLQRWRFCRAATLQLTGPYETQRNSPTTWRLDSPYPTPQRGPSHDSCCRGLGAGSGTGRAWAHGMCQAKMADKLEDLAIFGEFAKSDQVTVLPPGNKPQSPLRAGHA
jgi:hypothetical protein